MKRAYLVQGDTGSYDDFTKWVVCVCMTREAADRVAGELTLACVRLGVHRVPFEEVRTDDAGWNARWELLRAAEKELAAMDPHVHELSICSVGLSYEVVECEVRT